MISALILAAGKGTRLKSDKPKVLHEVKNKPSVFHVIELAKKFTDDIVVIIGFKHETVRDKIESEFNDIKFALQIPQNGTADAVLKGMPYVKEYSDAVIVLSGDAPSLKENTLKKLIDDFKNNKRLVSFIAAELPDPAKYGRVVLKDGKVVKIVEFADASEEEKEINLVNSGVYIFKKDFLKEAVSNVKNENNSNEFYLPDLIKTAALSSDVGLIIVDDYREILGFNTKEQLQYLNSI